MINPIFLPELRAMLAEGDAEGLAGVMRDLHPATIAEFSEGLSVSETWRLLEHGSVERQAAVFVYFPLAKQAALVRGGDRLAGLLEAMAPDSRAELLRSLPREVGESLLPLLSKDERQDACRLLSYPPHSAGALMTTDFAWLPVDTTVAGALDLVRKQAPASETIYYLYVVDGERHLVGFVSLRDLVLAEPAVRIDELMRRDLITVRAQEDREDVARKLSKYDFLAIPVVDAEQRLLGIVTYDDAIDVVVQEATEDVLRGGGVGPLVENYLELSYWKVWRNRAVWLACLFVAELFTFTALAYFEDEMAKVLALSLFVPLCISTGGNSGSQAATLITRAMALGQMRPRDWRRVLRHELVVGTALGLTLGAIGFVRASLTPAAVLDSADRWMLAAVIAQSVALICLWGTLVGSMLPLIFRRLGVDPGYASSPFVATFVDVTGIVIYFSIAKVFLL
ncbi:MAG TPA: magnesium transporter [Pirellulales bacterium]|nr:magnesium transporter [Pirellulales bacterium]